MRFIAERLSAREATNLASHLDGLCVSCGFRLSVRGLSVSGISLNFAHVQGDSAQLLAIAST